MAKFQARLSIHSSPIGLRIHSTFGSGGRASFDYVPLNTSQIVDQGIIPYNFPGDTVGLTGGLSVTKDFFGNPIVGMPDMGAIELPVFDEVVGGGSEQRSSVGSFTLTMDGGTGFNPILDFDSDGDIDNVDLSRFLQRYGNVLAFE